MVKDDYGEKLMLTKSMSGIKFKFILIFTVILLGISMIGYVYKSVLTINAESEKKKVHIFTTTQLIHQIESSIRRSREAEKNYFLEKDVRYAREHADILSETRALVDKLMAVINEDSEATAAQNGPAAAVLESNSAHIGNSEAVKAQKNDKDTSGDGNIAVNHETNIATIVEQISRLINEYESGFRFVVEAKEKRLSSIDSLRELAAKLSEIVSASGDLNLISSLLKMRGYEKDYISTGDPAFVTSLNNEMKDFALLLFDAEMDVNKRNELSKLMNNYNLGMLALTNGTKTVDDRVLQFNNIERWLRFFRQ